MHSASPRQCSTNIPNVRYIVKNQLNVQLHFKLVILHMAHSMKGWEYSSLGKIFCSKNYAYPKSYYA